MNRIRHLKKERNKTPTFNKLRLSGQKGKMPGSIKAITFHIHIYSYLFVGKLHFFLLGRATINTAARRSLQFSPNENHNLPTQSFSKHLLRTYSVPGSLLSEGDTATNKSLSLLSISSSNGLVPETTPR